MRRGRLFLILALIVLITLGVIYILTRGVEPAGQDVITQPSSGEVTPAPTPIPVMEVVVVTQRVVRGEVIGEDKLDLAIYQANQAWPIMYTSIDQVVGKTARFSMEPYTVVTSALVTDVSDRDQGSDDALFIESGKVAVSIPVSRLSSISYAPARGDRVNVIVTLALVDIDPDWQTVLPNMTGNVIAPGGSLVGDVVIDNPETITTLMALPFVGSAPLGRLYEDTDLEQLFYLLPSEAQRPRLVSQTLIQNVMVLQLGNFPTPYERAQAELPVVPTPTPNPAAPAEESAVAEEEETPPAPPDVITLIVSPQDAVTLNYLIFSGAQLTLAMRNPLDTSIIPTEAVTISFLLDQYNIPIPVKLPYGFQPAVSELIQPVLTNDIVPTPEP